MRKDAIYLQIANSVEQQIRNNVFRAGEKLPSLRTICTEKGVSLSTATQSYFELESRGLIESRPQSGYYVSYSIENFKEVPSTTKPALISPSQDAEEIIFNYTKNLPSAKMHFSAGIPAIEMMPIAKLNKAIVNAVRDLPNSGINYEHLGNSKLKKQIAQRSIHWGGSLRAQDIVTTSGSMEAISSSMMSLVEKGDTIVVESPLYYGILQLAKSLGLKVLELPTNPVTGIELDALKRTLEKKKVKLCLLVTNFNNPLGSCMPDENKKEVVRLMEKHNVPLIEDDLYGDLYFGDHRPSTCKSFDESGIVLWCGSFSKTLAPGYRVGWVAPGKFIKKVERVKHYHALSSNTITHEAIASFLENGRYEHHLRRLRQTLHKSMLQMLRAISEYFPTDTRATRPQGGFHLWVELGGQKNSLDLYNKAMAHKIGIAPGRMYTLQDQYNNCFRINSGVTWNEKTEEALKLLGKLAR